MIEMIILCIQFNNIHAIRTNDEYVGIVYRIQIIYFSVFSDNAVGRHDGLLSGRRSYDWNLKKSCTVS